MYGENGLKSALLYDELLLLLDVDGRADCGRCFALSVRLLWCHVYPVKKVFLGGLGGRPHTTHLATLLVFFLPHMPHSHISPPLVLSGGGLRVGLGLGV